MTTISSIASDAADLLAKQTAKVGQAATAAKTSFEATLSQVQSTLAGKPKTGFTSGPTYEAGSWTAQTKASFDNALSATKSAITPKPTTGFRQ
jgi:hypothetical protein